MAIVRGFLVGADWSAARCGPASSPTTGAVSVVGDKPLTGYTYDTLAEDLSVVADGLDLRDATLVGFSMGGGEVARYCAKFGTDRLGNVVFAAAVTPYLLHTDDDPEGPLNKKQAAQMAGSLTANHDSFRRGPPSSSRSTGR